MNLAALERAARLFDSQVEADKQAPDREFQRPQTPDGSHAAQCEVCGPELRPVTGFIEASRRQRRARRPPARSNPLAFETRVTGEGAYSATESAAEQIPDKFLFESVVTH
jgi:hypothetical protein